MYDNFGFIYQRLWLVKTREVMKSAGYHLNDGSLPHLYLVLNYRKETEQIIHVLHVPSIWHRPLSKYVKTKSA